MVNNFERIPLPPKSYPAQSNWFIFQKDKMLVKKVNDNEVVLPVFHQPQDLNLKAQEEYYLGKMEGVHSYAISIDEEESLPEGYEVMGLRQLYSMLGELPFFVSGFGYQLIYWNNTSKFCGRCGTANEMMETERTKKCPNCGMTTYPRLSPAVIVAITKGDKILLARSARFPRGFFSVLAGFVEPGETLEECVAREVKEEVNLDVKNIRYFGSQPWPFPNSLMLGFTAEYASGEIVPEVGEIEEADWFGADEMPDLPGKISISRKLIDWFLEREGANLRADKL